MAAKKSEKVCFGKVFIYCISPIYSCITKYKRRKDQMWKVTCAHQVTSEKTAEKLFLHFHLLSICKEFVVNSLLLNEKEPLFFFLKGSFLRVKSNTWIFWYNKINQGKKHCKKLIRECYRKKKKKRREGKEADGKGAGSKSED